MADDEIIEPSTEGAQPRSDSESTTGAAENTVDPPEPTSDSSTFLPADVATEPTAVSPDMAPQMPQDPTPPASPSSDSESTTREPSEPVAPPPEIPSTTPPQIQPEPTAEPAPTPPPDEIPTPPVTPPAAVPSPTLPPPTPEQPPAPVDISQLSDEQLKAAAALWAKKNQAEFSKKGVAKRKQTMEINLRIIVDYLSRHNGAPLPRIARHTNITPGTTSKYLRQLIAADKVRAEGWAKNRRYYLK